MTIFLKEQGRCADSKDLLDPKIGRPHGRRPDGSRSTKSPTSTRVYLPRTNVNLEKHPKQSASGATPLLLPPPPFPSSRLSSPPAPMLLHHMLLINTVGQVAYVYPLLPSAPSMAALKQPC